MMWYQDLTSAAGAQSCKPALVQGDRTVSYGQLFQASEALAASLERGGLCSGQTAAMWMPNSIEHAIALLAIARIGAAALVLDPALKADEIARYDRRAGAVMLLHEPRDSVAARPPPGAGGQDVPVLAVPSCDVLCLEAGGALAQTPRPASEAHAFLLLSSGTTGPAKIVPKTVAQATGALRVFSDTLPYNAGDRILGVLPFCHSFGLFNVLLASLRAGATLYIERFSPRPTAAAIARHRITVLPATPFMVRMLAETDFRTAPDFSSVRLAVSAGSALSAAVVRRTREKFGIGVAQSYGTTESGPITIARSEDCVDAPGWVGTPYAGVTVEIRDSSGVPLGADLDGAVVVRSPANASCYLGDAEKSAATFDGGWVLTGDIGRLSKAGHLFVLGRTKRMINVAGKKVAPAEVEACLRSHPSVAEALVVADRAPDGGERVKALVVPAGEASVRQLQEFCAARLADFKVPRQIVFVEDLAAGRMGKPTETLPASDEGRPIA